MLLSALLVLAMLVTAPIAPEAAASDAPRPPAQPADGPGGRNAPYAQVLAERVGSAPTGAWVFRPADADAVVPSGRTFPLVLFFHGFTATDPDVYRAWIDHVALRGAVVVYPDYQTDNLFRQDPAAYLADALAGVRAGLDVLAADQPTLVDPTRVVAVGHSLGGVLAANYAAVAADEGLPVPDVLMPVAPGGCGGCGDAGDRLGTPLLPLGDISPQTYALVIVAADDDLVGDTAARIIWAGLGAIPADRRDYVIAVSDDHGEPELEADHNFAQSGGLSGEVDALDWYGPWKLLDGLMACAFGGDGEGGAEVACAVGLGDTAAQRAMGRWDDGRPVAEMRVTDTPPPPPD